MTRRGLVSQLKSKGIIAKAYSPGDELGPNNALFDNEKAFHSLVAENQWLLIDFGKSVLVESYSIKSPAKKLCLSNWDLEVSKDNSTFYSIDSKRDEIPQTEMKYAMYAPSMSVKTRYMRIYSRGHVYDDPRFQIYILFIDFYGDPLFSCFTHKQKHSVVNYLFLVYSSLAIK